LHAPETEDLHEIADECEAHSEYMCKFEILLSSESNCLPTEKKPGKGSIIIRNQNNDFNQFVCL
jgi:hypothetical protein